MSEETIKAWRETRGLSQKAAGSRLGLSRWTINQIENGKYLPSWRMSQRLAEATGIPLHKLNSDIFPAPQKEAANG